VNASQSFNVNISDNTNVTISTCNLFTAFDTVIAVDNNVTAGNNDALDCVASNGFLNGKQSIVMLVNIGPGFNFTVFGNNGNVSGLYGVSIDCNGLNPRAFHPNLTQNLPSVSPYPFYTNYSVHDCANVSGTLGVTQPVDYSSSSSSYSGSSGSSGSSNVIYSGSSSSMTGVYSSTGIYGGTGSGANALSASPFVSLILGAILFVIAF